ncbi:MAG: lamin tail domain-containing protein [Candidatus Microsaccharimonas sp.]
MLKKCYGLFLGLVVLASSACVTPTHASSASILITNVRAGGSLGATEESVVLYNNSSFEVVMNDWCLTNKAQLVFACVRPHTEEQVILPAYSYATIVSSMAKTNVLPDFYTAVYEPANHSSGAIVASADTISLIDDTGQLVDQFTWATSVASNQQWERTKLGILPDFYIDTNSTSDWQKLNYIGLPASGVEYRNVVVEEPPETGEPEIPSEPIDPVIPDPAEPQPEPLPLLSLVITEILPNAVGSDTGNEFIEIYNPNQQDTMALAGYKLAIGPSLEKSITLPNITLQPQEYRTFTNAELGYSLLNSSSKVALFDSIGLIVSETPVYTSPPEGRSWALIEGGWYYTSPTPGAQNILSDSEDDDVENDTNQDTSAVSVLKPCAANQYRSLETNRCRLLTSSVASKPTQCKVGQERNPETNRCRAIASSAGSAACKEGQERNPETNRCRNIKKLSTADFGVKGATIKQQSGMGWYMWAAIGGVVALIVGYAVWEWRQELKAILKVIRAKFARKAK